MPAARIVFALSLGLVLVQAGSMTFPALMPALMAQWGLNAAEAGWIAGMYFAGYLVAVPFLSTLTDRIDARPLVAVGALVAAVGGLGFAFLVDGFWSAMAMRFLTGVGVAGVHMPGLGLLAERLDGDARRRGSAIYTACYALGTAGSFLIAGLVATIWDWRAAFAVSGAAAVLVLPLVLCIGPARAPAAPRPPAGTALLDFRPVLRNRDAMAYVTAYAGNTWEVFGVRAWFVAFLVFSMALPGNAGETWNPALVSAFAAFLGVPAGIAMAELSVRRDRRIVIAATAGMSVLVCLAIAGLAGAATWLLVALLVLHGVTSYGDAPSISSGVVEAAGEGQRGATLAVFAVAGFLPGLIAPLAVGLVLELGGGVGSQAAWTAAFVLLGLGSLVSALAMRRASPPRP